MNLDLVKNTLFAIYEDRMVIIFIHLNYNKYIFEQEQQKRKESSSQREMLTRIVNEKVK